MVLYLLSLAVLYPKCMLGNFFFQAISLPLCGTKLRHIFCTNWSVFRLSCVDRALNSTAGQFLAVTTILFPLFFVAICRPLHYHSKNTFRTVLFLLILSVLYPVCIFGYYLYQSSTLLLCGYKLHRLFCTSWSVIQLSIVNTAVINVAGQCLAVISIFITLSFVLYTYLRILLVCRRRSCEFRGKALQACLPHIVTFGNFCISIFCEVSLSLYKIDEVNPFVIAVFSLEFLFIPPISNPLVYGLNLPQIRGVIVTSVKIQ